MMRWSSVLVLAVGCGPTAVGTPDAHGGGHTDAMQDAGPQPPDIDAPLCGIVATFRDFQSSHPDFEKTIHDDRGLAKMSLASDHKPEFAPGMATMTVSGKTSFDQWYRDVPGVNQTFVMQLPLTENPPGTFTYDNSAFFPLDGKGFPETFLGHNFHFTTEIHTSFAYHGGEVFTFTGDDDVFVFVNDRLAIDLGGVHGAESATIDFDMMAGQLGISTGNVYRFDVFHAERHTSESNFRMSTTIDCFVIL
jgi:fibro-slime domain-containing protein